MDSSNNSSDFNVKSISERSKMIEKEEIRKLSNYQFYSLVFLLISIFLSIVLTVVVVVFNFPKNILYFGAILLPAYYLYNKYTNLLYGRSYAYMRQKKKK